MSPRSESTVSWPPDFLVFSDDWGEHPSSCQHIFRYIAKKHRVLWINTIGMRNPTFTLTDVRKVMRKASKMLGTRNVPAAGAKPEGNITVCQPFMLPAVRSRLARAINSRSVTTRVSALLQALQFDAPVVVTTVPNAAEYPDLLEGRKVIYYCVDDFSLWPGLDAGLVREMETRLIERADCIVAVSDTLFRRLSKSGKPTYLLTHGVDLEMFSRPAKSEHSVLRNIQRPRVGFFGLIDARLDQDLVSQVAQRMPEFSFIFAGPIDSSASRLTKEPNVHFIGPFRHSELPELILGFDCLIIPYRPGLLADTISPLKLKEYLATGKPIVSAQIADTYAWGELIKFATNPEEWCHAILETQTESTGARKKSVSSLLADETWMIKAKQLLEMSQLMRNP